MHFTCIVDFNLNNVFSLSNLYCMTLKISYSIPAQGVCRAGLSRDAPIMKPEAPEALGEYNLVMHLVLFIHLSPNTY